MREAEHRALFRAAVLLLGISVVRWMAGTGGTATVEPAPTGEDALRDHQAATAEALTEAEERALPLTRDEKIDPNRATEVQLDRLPGVGPATARAIMAARDTGLVFRRADDLLVVRGIGPASLERLRPWLDLPVATGLAGASLRRPLTGSGSGVPARSGQGPETAVGPVDVNRADAEALQALPGIGPALAARIVAERRTRPFESLDDLVRVRGIGPSTIVRVRPHARAGPRQ